MTDQPPIQIPAHLMGKTEREPTPAQLDACKHAKLDPAAGEWHGDVLVIPYWSGEDLYALVSEHGSITYCAGVMLDAHKAGIPT